MSKKDDSLALLPNGFVDLLPPYAEGEARSIQKLMETFAGFGYLRIKPPLLEFEDSLLAPGPGERLASETFRLMDPVSHRMLGFRSDITAQVSRIVSSRMKNTPRPLRLMYANNVLRTKGSQLRTERQFAQVGCELIGQTKSLEGDIEICVLSLLGLKALGIENITVDFTIPGFVSHLLQDIKDEDVEDIINKAVSQRDLDTLNTTKHKVCDVIGQAMQATGHWENAIESLEKIKFDKEIKTKVSLLKTVCNGIQQALEDLKIDGISMTLDVLEQSGFEYHKSLGFTLFSSNIRGELGRGGSYDVHFGQNEHDEMARGFTLYMDTISKSIDPPEDEQRVFIPLNVPWHVIMDLQRQGWITVRAADPDEKPQGCSHVYNNGKIEDIN